MINSPDRTRPRPTSSSANHRRHKMVTRVLLAICIVLSTLTAVATSALVSSPSASATSTPPIAPGLVTSDTLASPSSLNNSIAPALIPTSSTTDNYYAATSTAGIVEYPVPGSGTISSTATIATGGSGCGSSPTPYGMTTDGTSIYMLEKDPCLSQMDVYKVNSSLTTATVLWSSTADYSGAGAWTEYGVQINEITYGAGKLYIGNWGGTASLTIVNSTTGTATTSTALSSPADMSYDASTGLVAFTQESGFGYIDTYNPSTTSVTRVPNSNIAYNGLTALGGYIYIFTGSSMCASGCTLYAVNETTGGSVVVAGSTSHIGTSNGIGGTVTFEPSTGIANDGASLWAPPNTTYGSMSPAREIAPLSTTTLPVNGPLPPMSTVAPSCNCGSKQSTHGTTAEPVDTATGEFYTTNTPLAVPGPGVPLALTTTYSTLVAQNEISTSAGPGALGYGWSTNLTMSLTTAGTTNPVTVTMANGAQLVFNYYATGATLPTGSGSSTWCPSDATSPVYCITTPNNTDSLAYNGTNWTLTDMSAGPTTYTFNSSKKLSQVADAAGDTLTATAGTPGSGNCPSSASSCTVWTSSSTRTITLAYNSTSKLLSATDSAGNVTAFCQFGQACAPGSGGQTGDLMITTQYSGTAAAQATAYTYATTAGTNYQHNMLTLTPPGGSSTDRITNTYDAAGRTITQTQPDGDYTTFAYSDTSYTNDNDSTSGGTTIVTDYPGGSGSSPTTVDTYYYVDGVQQAETINAPSTNATMTYGRNNVALLPTTQINLNGNSATATVDSTLAHPSQPSANVTLSTDADGNTTQYAYTALNLPWCQVDPADYANGTRCPSTQPTAPPAPGATYAYPGVALTFYSTTVSGQVTATTDALGNTTTFAYTTSSSGVPANLVFCTVSPSNYANSVTCPSNYTTSHTAATTSYTYDTSGDKLTSTNPDGNTTTNTYYTTGTSAGLVHAVTDPDGGVTTYTYNAAGQVTVQSQTFGSYTATTNNAYDTNGRLYCTVAPNEVALSITCPSSPPSTPPTPSSSPTLTTDPYLGATINTYTALGQQIQTTNPIGGVTYSAYDKSNNLYCTVTPAQAAAGKTCPSSPPSAPTTSSDPYLGDTITTYNAANQVIQTTNPIGGITLYTYDNAGNKLSQTTETNSSSAPNVITNYTYDPAGNVTQTTVDPSSSLTQTSESFYDPNGNVYCSVSAKAYALGTASTNFQCPTWQTGWVTSPPNPTSLYSATPTSTQANNATMSFYDANGNLRQQTGPLSTGTNPGAADTTVSAYTPDGQTYCTASAANTATYLAAHSGATYPYLCPTTPPTSATATGYVTSVYDAADLLTASSDALANATSYTYDPAGNQLTVTSPTSGVTTNCYYWQNNVSGANSCAYSATAGAGAATALYSTTSPPTKYSSTGVATTYTYLPGGTTHVVTTPAGTQTDSYDASLDLTATAYTGTATGYTAPTNTSYTYYVDGTRHTVTDGAGTTTTTYDAAGDTTSVALAATGSGLSSKTTSYTYYQNQARATTVYPTFGGTSTPTVTYTYDATGAEATLVDWLSHTITFSHDADANTTATLYPTTGTSTTTVTSSFDNADALTNVSAAPTSSPSSVIAGYATPRNGSEQVASETDSGSAITASTQSYGYSASNQLASVTAGTGPGTTNNASYDPANNPTTLAATSTTSTTAGATQNYDNAGELCWQDTAVPSPLPTDPNARCATASPTPTTGTTVSTYSYNQSGDRTATAAATTSGTTTSNYAYTQTDQLATFTPSTGSATTYTYNADGLRVSKTTASTTTQFVYDTAQSTPQVLEDPANAYIYGPTGTAVEQVSSAGTPTYYVTDQLGSTRALISLAATVVGTFTYGPTGTLMSSTGTLTSPLGFAGGYTDAETGFEYLVNRYYDPTSDQFLSVDTLVDSTKAPYYYASDNAVNYTDPTGNSTHGYCVGLSGAATTYVVNPSVGGFGCLLEDSSQNIGFSAMGYNSAGTRARGESVAGHVIDTLKSFLANGVIGAQASLLDMNTNSQTLDGLHGTWSMYGGTAGVGIHGGIGAGWTAGDIYRGSNSGFMIGLNVGVGFGLPLSYGGTSGFNVSANHPADLGTLGYKYYFYAGLLKGLDLLMWPLLNQFGLSAKEGVDGERQQVAACQR